MNRHIKIAIMVSPLLGLLAYHLTDNFVSGQRPAGVYQLQSKGLCQPLKHSCAFTSGNVELTLMSSIKKGQTQLAILASYPLQQMSLALSEAGEIYQQFQLMKSVDGKYWQIQLSTEQRLEPFNHVRLATSSAKSQYYIENNIRFEGP